MGRDLFRFCLLVAIAALTAAVRAEPGAADDPCPSGALMVDGRSSVQDAVDAAGEGATFCLENGVYRGQAIRPKQGQRFFGRGRTVLNGSRPLTGFAREGRYWVAAGPEWRGRKHGQCAKETPACALPEGLFVDDKPLIQVLNREAVQPGRFYFDRAAGHIYFADDPAGRKVEATVAAFAFRSRASDVVISNITIEKYASVAQEGAIQAQDTTGWIIEKCEVRLNSGAGIAVGNGTHVRDCNIHHNGQIGITGVGRDVLIEGNDVWANNSRGFSSAWEAGGVKLAESENVVLRRNHVHDNLGPGLWCDINCRNVLYENNVVERNNGAGVFHEISFSAVIRRNVIRHNAITDSGWFGGDNVLIAASQDVDVYDNVLTVSPGKCGVMLIDQSRPFEGSARARSPHPAKYKTRNNKVHDNEMVFEGAVCAGGASDAEPGDENFSIIADGNNVVDANIYRVPRDAGPQRFVWGHAVFQWSELRKIGIETDGQLVFY
jgi:hypothetical protein